MDKDVQERIKLMERYAKAGIVLIDPTRIFMYTPTAMQGEKPKKKIDYSDHYRK